MNDRRLAQESMHAYAMMHIFNESQMRRCISGRAEGPGTFNFVCVEVRTTSARSLKTPRDPQTKNNRISPAPSCTTQECDYSSALLIFKGESFSHHLSTTQASL
jgi:hypothetical protein